MATDELTVLDRVVKEVKRVRVPDRDPADNGGKVTTAPIDNVPEDQRPKAEKPAAPSPAPANSSK